MIRFIFAHAGEVHDSTITASAHELAWYVQLPLFFIVVAMFGSLIWLVSKRQDTTLLITSFALLIAGFSLFKVAPIASATAITLGLVTTLAVTLLGLGSPEKK